MTSETAAALLLERNADLSLLDWRNQNNIQLRRLLYEAGVAVPTTASYMTDVIEAILGQEGFERITLHQDNQPPKEHLPYLYEVEISRTIRRRVYVSAMDLTDTQTIQDFVDEHNLEVDDWSGECYESEIRVYKQ